MEAKIDADSTYPREMELHFHVYAVVFGSDETILNVNLENSFYFIKHSLNPRIGHLDKVFDRTDFELRRDYE